MIRTTPTMIREYSLILSAELVNRALATSLVDLLKKF